MKPKMCPTEAQESFLGEISSQDEARDVAKRGSRKLQESFLGEISSLEVSR